MSRILPSRGEGVRRSNENGRMSKKGKGEGEDGQKGKAGVGGEISFKKVGMGTVDKEGEVKTRVKREKGEKDMSKKGDMR